MTNAFFPANLETWIKFADTYPWMREPYDRPCPSCGEPMMHPTKCVCSFEQRVFALAELDDDVYGPYWARGNLIKINKAMRALDDSNSYPINGRFNATDRAIRRVRNYGLENLDGLDSYIRAVDWEIGRIVNS
jgi:hypothetical protein